MSDETNRQQQDASAPTIGARIRALRRAAGLTQEQLAGDRFSKEYVSQIERGKTRPSAAALDWLAVRLTTDRAFLEQGFHGHELDAVLERLDAAEALSEQQEYEGALELYRSAEPAVGRLGLPSLAVRLDSGAGWALLRLGDVEGALSLLEHARDGAVAPECTDGDRAKVLFQIAVGRYSRSEIPEAIGLFTEALALANSTGLDRLRVDILGWRSRCHRRERDWSLAWDDVELALDLARRSESRRQLADVSFQASLITHRQGRWVVARKYAEEAKELYDGLGDRATAARVLNNIAGLDHLLGDAERAIARLQEAFAVFVDVGLPVEAGYVLSSQADIHLTLDEFAEAETQARKALELLGERVDHLQEIGAAQLALGRALARQGKTDEAEDAIAAAERTFERARSTSHQAEASIARGDLESSRGNDRGAAAHYLQAVDSLQESELDLADMFSGD